MKIGILTFHWATNYGAVLQTYALQQYLLDYGHEVEIINYKPRKYDFFVRYLTSPWLILRLRKDIVAYKKEKKLIKFRNNNCIISDKRFLSCKQLNETPLDYDLIISGSDQVLNPHFTLLGENRPTPTYYLTFAKKIRRIGYALSFGCTNYPSESLVYAKKWINSFDRIAVRENSGLTVLSEMDFLKEKVVVPDPTLLYGKKLFENLNVLIPHNKNYICIYVLRECITLDTDNIIYIDDLNNPLSMEQWLGTIIASSGMVTNSYHGMIMAILNHVPFVVLLETKKTGMNDRFLTLLSRLGLENRICNILSNYDKILRQPIEWDEVEKRIDEFRKIGVNYLKPEICI